MSSALVSWDPDIEVEQSLNSNVGVSRAFLHSLRTLFDILDDRKRGMVHISEIESRWRVQPEQEGHQEADQGREDYVPEGVILALRQVATPCTGFLTFPRFVTGLRIALLRDSEQHSEDSLCKSPEKVSVEQQSTREGSENIKPPTDSGLERTSKTQYGQNEGKGITRSLSINSSLTQAEGRRNVHCRNKPRRHTITNGLDYDLLKRMKELEQERDILHHGLQMVEQTREWYHQQILDVQEKQRHIGQDMANNDYFSDLHNNRGCLLLAKIQEANFYLSGLISSTGKTTSSSPSYSSSSSSSSCYYSPVHRMPSARTLSCNSPDFQQQAWNVLKEQNRLLSKEVSDKSEQITQLEQERDALYQQLKEVHVQRKLATYRHKESAFI
ncbi:suppressor APC domain-containing protein 2-like [Protopterus annectens]|uniref:suppressor APC domain-containing protein 2-like n=1 Tax=Protopterus annectens TaxID=7888 RepID=UPI001CFAE257|nr:suppressor APC domain-containing protein 2-like [Protopterus annectens]